MALQLTALDKLAAARHYAIKQAPYFRSGFMSLIPRESTKISTLAVTKNWVMLYNPVFVEKTSKLELSGVYMHELGHLILKHPDRLKALGAESQLGNVAADLADNDMLRAYRLPEGALWPETYNLPSGKTIEFYYRELRKQREAQEKERQEKEGEGDTGSGSVPADRHGRKNTPQCGGCAAHAHASEAEAEGEDGRSNQEIARTEREMAKEISEHVRANGAGSIPGALAAWANIKLDAAKVNWRAALRMQVLRAVTHTQGAVLSRYNRPSRRQAGLGYGVGAPILPALCAPVPRIGVALDCSGSMSPDVIAAALNEVEAIAKTHNVGISFACFDDTCTPIGTITSAREGAKKLKRYGGTNFVPVFDAFNKLTPRVDMLVVITDGYGPAPTKAPAYAVSWALIGGAKAPVSYGKAIVID